MVTIQVEEHSWSMEYGGKPFITIWTGKGVTAAKRKDNSWLITESRNQNGIHGCYRLLPTKKNNATHKVITPKRTYYLRKG